MESLINQSYKLFKIDPNFNGQVIYPSGIKYSGEWKNGLKVGNGILENQYCRIEVKIKEGQIHKCIRVLYTDYSVKNLRYEFTLPNIRIIKRKDYYEEEFSIICLSRYVIANNNCLFDGKHYQYHVLKMINFGNSKINILQLTENRFSPLILDLEFQGIRLIGPCFNLNPNGVCKIIIKGFIFKGNMKGIINNGTCTVKNEYFKALTAFDIKGMKYPFTIISKNLGFEMLVNYSAPNKCIIPEKTGKNLEIAYSCLPEISEFVDKLTYEYYMILKFLLVSGVTSRIASYCLVADKDWKIFEYDLNERKKMQEYSQGIIKDSSSLDLKSLKVFRNNERYEGKVVDGKFEGFGKYFYADGSVYIGEFKNNLRNGIGIFKFRDGSLYRGYWADNMMHGKGFIIQKGKKIFGQWVKNELLQGGDCFFIDLF